MMCPYSDLRMGLDGSKPHSFSSRKCFTIFSFLTALNRYGTLHDFKRGGRSHHVHCLMSCIPITNRQEKSYGY